MSLDPKEIIDTCGKIGPVKKIFRMTEIEHAEEPPALKKTPVKIAPRKERPLQNGPIPNNQSTAFGDVLDDLFDDLFGFK